MGTSPVTTPGMPKKEHEEYLKRFGKHLEELRKSKNLTLRKLAQKCDIDFSDISRYEKGEINLSFMSMLELCDGLEITLKELMDF